MVLGRALTCSSEELHALPYLDKVIHETLRLESPIPISIREAMKDTVLPLDKPIRGIDGKLIESIPVKKGDRIHIRTYVALLLTDMRSHCLH